MLGYVPNMNKENMKYFYKIRLPSIFFWQFSSSEICDTDTKNQEPKNRIIEGLEQFVLQAWYIKNEREQIQPHD